MRSSSSEGNESTSCRWKRGLYCSLVIESNWLAGWVGARDSLELECLPLEKRESVDLRIFREPIRLQPGQTPGIQTLKKPGVQISLQRNVKNTALLYVYDWSI